MSTASDKSIIYRYLPRTLIQHATTQADRWPVWGQWLDGSLMHCDVTGFTAMSEALARSGNEGAEFMAAILNRFFETMLSIANRWDGVQMKFGGDAMLLYFGADGHASRAAASALDMQQAMQEFSDIAVMQDNYRLMMRIGIHSGRFYSASLGQADNLLHYMLFGYDVNKTADVEPLAEPGQVVVSQATRDLLDQRFKVSTTQYDYIWQVMKHNLSPVPEASVIHSEDDLTLLNRYLMPAIANGKVAGLTGEHRRVSVVFIYIEGSSELLDSAGDVETLRQMNIYLNLVLEGIQKYGGNLITSDVSEHGDKLLICFGAPSSCENQEESAARFACELNDELERCALSIKHQIGINSGYVFTGEIGGLNRREYTTIGDTTNLAARLMMVAEPGEIIASAASAEKFAALFDMTALEPIRVKGKSQPISIYKINKLDEHGNPALFKHGNHPLCGRTLEFDQLIKIAEHARAGHCSLAYITGESGIGKSRLCFEFTKLLKESGWLSLTGICQSYSKHTAYRAWFYPLREIMGITANDTQTSAWQKISSTIEQYIPDLSVFAPLVADMLSVGHELNPMLESLDANTKCEKRHYTLIRLLEAISKSKPIIVFFDNVQWADGLSKQLFAEIMSVSKLPILFCVASRVPLDENLYPQGKQVIQLVLGELSNEHARQLLQYYDLPLQATGMIIDRAKGNPLFLEELAKSDIASGSSLPESVYDVVMSRLDRLDVRKKSMLKTTSVIGQIFDSNLLNGLARDIKEISGETGRT